jgi:hypothetical protein
MLVPLARLEKAGHWNMKKVGPFVGTWPMLSTLNGSNTMAALVQRQCLYMEGQLEPGTDGESKGGEARGPVTMATKIGLTPWSESLSGTASWQ